MSTPTFAQKDAAIVLAEALALYKSITGQALAPADPRRLHLQALLAQCVQLRALIDYSGKQNLLRYVGDDWIEEFAALWGESKTAAGPSTCTQRFNAAVASVIVIAAGKRVTDGTSIWQVLTTATSAPGSTYLDVTVSCTVNGSASNGVAIGQIDTLVDAIPGITSTSNTTETISGRERETTAAFRERLRDSPESASVAGPRLAYEALARAASASVSDVVVLGPNDAPYMAGTAPTPGEVHVLIMETDLATPSAGLLTAVADYVTDETRRPLGDDVTVKAPLFVGFDIDVTWYIARSRADSVAEITEAVEAAYEEYKTWQNKIGRDINPDKLVQLVVSAGAKRLSNIGAGPTYLGLERDQCSQLGYEEFVFGGVVDD